MRINIIYVLLLAVCLWSSCQEKRKDRFEREAREYTVTHCPQSYGDGVTTLDSMVFEQNDDAGVLKLYYTLQLTDEQRGKLMNKLGEMGDQNLKIVRNSVLFVKHKEAGVDFMYIYHDAKTGEKIAEYRFAKKDYE